MDDSMSAAHDYRTVDVPVRDGMLRVGIWDVEDPHAPTVLLVHGVTASHLAWEWVVQALPGVRVIAPDLRGRGASNNVDGPAGMRAHADDLAAVLNAIGVTQTLVVGHSMGAFVAVVFADRHPDRVTRLLLVDGGLPLEVPAGLTTDQIVQFVLGPTAARLSMRFASTEAYLDFWRQHPAFVDHWSPEVERYFAYDLVGEAPKLHPATSYETTADDTVDLNTGTAVVDALAGLRHPVLLLTAPRGLQNQTPGLYADADLPEMLARHPGVRHERVDDVNHYTIVMSHAGGETVGARVREQLALDAAEGAGSPR